MGSRGSTLIAFTARKSLFFSRLVFYNAKRFHVRLRPLAFQPKGKLSV